MQKSYKVLITGGTGSWGRELIDQLLAKTEVSEIRVFSRNEAKQVDLKDNIAGNRRVKFIVGDIRDRDRLTEACEQVDIVYHLAALKHVPVCEGAPLEAVKTNILGTQNLIDAARQCGVQKVIFISTDKAADPTGIYGYTKTIGERLMINANDLDGSTSFSVLRSGNILGSDGSVIPMFEKQLKRAGKVQVTNPKMTRFFVTADQAVMLLLEVTERCAGGEIFIMKMPAFNIGDLAKAVLKHYGQDDNKMVEIGAREGEKINEVLVSQDERAKIFDFDDHFYLIPAKGCQQYSEKMSLSTAQLASLDSANAVADFKMVCQLLNNSHCLQVRL